MSGGGQSADDPRPVNTALAADPGEETVQIMEYFNSSIGTPNESAQRKLLLGSDGKIDCSGTGAQFGVNDVINCVGREWSNPGRRVAGLRRRRSCLHRFRRRASLGCRPSRTRAGARRSRRTHAAAAATAASPSRPRLRRPQREGKAARQSQEDDHRLALATGSVRRASSSKIGRGSVISEHPRAGAHLPRGARVSLVVSLGRKGTMKC